MNKNKNKVWKRKTVLAICLLISFILANFFVVPVLAEEDIEELNNRIEGQRREIDILQKEIDAYAEQIRIKQKEVKSLQNQLAILDNQIAKLNLDIETTEIRIEKTNLEIQSLNIRIENLEKEIDKNKKRIAEYLRLIYKDDQISYFEIILVNNSFSDFFDKIKYTEEIHADLNKTLKGLKKNKQEIAGQKADLEQKIEEERELKNDLQQQKDELTEKSSVQGMIVLQTKLTEKQYQNYLYQLQLEQQQINSEISSLEKEVRKKLEDREASERFKNFGPARLAWPVSPARGITAYFHDPTYPFRYIFEHPGVDVRAYQGTKISAAEAGYVARVKFRGDSSYAYIMIIHNEGISTVYGHVSATYVKEDEYVTRGQIIGLTGGMPGTAGAGNLSTGPHLHLEVRLNGIPVNPLEYLPSL